MVETLKTPRIGEVACRPISPHLGAVVDGIDARKPLSCEQVDGLKALLMRFKVLFFPRQALSFTEQERFAAQFGSPRIDPIENSVEGHPGLALVDKVPFFHADWMHQLDPPLWSMLQMNVVPEVGGDTMFADLVSSYEALSDALRGFLETLTVTQSHPQYSGDGSVLARSYMDGSLARGGASVDKESAEGDFAELIARVQPHSQPLVRYIPETGKKNYWVSRAFTRRINELEPTESDALLRFLFVHQLLPQFVIRWRWSPGDIAFWDHRTTLHSGVNDFGEAERHGCRASLVGGRLIPALTASA